jgi:hypothetical protein
MFACRQHWFLFPRALRAKLLETYSPGQEVRKNPSPAYLAAARALRAWAEDHSNPED